MNPGDDESWLAGRRFCTSRTRGQYMLCIVLLFKIWHSFGTSKLNTAGVRQDSDREVNLGRNEIERILLEEVEDDSL